MVNVVKFENIGPRSGSGVRQSLNFGMPDARKPVHGEFLFTAQV